MDEQRLPEARQEAVRSLEEAPRYRAAHRLFLEIIDKSDREGSGASATRPATPASKPATAPARGPSPKERSP
jgi:hypothetical protein